MDAFHGLECLGSPVVISPVGYRRTAEHRQLEGLLKFHLESRTGERSKKIRVVGDEVWTVEHQGGHAQAGLELPRDTNVTVHYTALGRIDGQEVVVTGHADYRSYGHDMRLLEFRLHLICREPISLLVPRFSKRLLRKIVPLQLKQYQPNDEVLWTFRPSRLVHSRDEAVHLNQTGWREMLATQPHLVTQPHVSAQPNAA